jgi:hypothetical protein
MERDVLTEQRTNMKFLVKLGKSGREILEMLQTSYGESATMHGGLPRRKSAQESLKNQDHAHSFFLYSRNSPSQICSTGSNS